MNAVRSWVVVTLAAWAMLAAESFCEEPRGEEFRVETDVFLGGEKEPIARNLTLFVDGLVYDFPLIGPQQATVFDADRGRFVILDVERKLKTTVTTQRLLEFSAAIRLHAEDLKGVFAFAAHPKFAEDFSQAEQSLVLASESLTYRAKVGEPKSKAASQQFQHFADWYARLNSMRPGSLPPFARIELNKAIGDRGVIPEEIALTIEPGNRFTGKKLEMKSRHLFNWRLSNTDRKRISEAGDQMASFQAVAAEEFFPKAAAPAEKKK